MNNIDASKEKSGIFSKKSDSENEYAINNDDIEDPNNSSRVGFLAHKEEEEKHLRSSSVRNHDKNIDARRHSFNYGG